MHFIQVFTLATLAFRMSDGLQFIILFKLLSSTQDTLIPNVHCKPPNSLFTRLYSQDRNLTEKSLHLSSVFRYRGTVVLILVERLTVKL